MTSTESPLEAKLRRQLAEWSKDLLPTDRRQRALYFKHTRAASLEIVQPHVDDIPTLLATGAVGLSAEDPDTLFDHPPQSLVVSGKTDAELAASLRTLERKSREVFVDRGFWTLYLGVGMLAWTDPDDGRSVVSPIVLVPVQLKRAATSSPATLARTQDEVVLNPVLALKMYEDFGIELPAIDDESFDVRTIVDLIGEIVSDQPGWGVHERCVLTTFSFHKEAMYRDLIENFDAVAASELVQLIALGPDAPSAADFGFAAVTDEQIDTAVPPEELMSILDADGSQRRCILAARDGRSFVMDGPPGTGKSQTIANIIVELIATGRTVLFVSEKAAALDVVRKRLAEAELGDYLLELHSHTATRKAVATELDRALTARSNPATGARRLDRPTLTAARRQLTSFARGMNETRPEMGRSLHQVVGRLAQLHEFANHQIENALPGRTVDSALLAQFLTRADELKRHWRPAQERDRFMWRDLLPDRHDFASIQRLTRSAARAANSASALNDRLQAIDEDLRLVLPVTTDSAKRRLSILEALDKRPSVPHHLLTRVDRSDVVAMARRLATQTSHYSEAARYLDATVGAAWGTLDLDQAGDLTRLKLADARQWRPEGLSTAPDFDSLIGFLQSDRHLVPMRTLADRLAAIFRVDAQSLSPAQTLELARLATLGASPSLPEPGWLNTNVQRALDESSRVLSELVAAVRSREQSLASVFRPEALSLDLPALHLRFRDVHHGLRKLARAARDDKKALKAVSVSGRADRTVVARLEEAATWQYAQHELSRNEPDHAPRLGRYYRGTGTDFTRLTSAIETAHQAVALAGRTVGSAALTQQIALDGSPDPQLHALGSQFIAMHDEWLADLRRNVGENADQLASRRYEDIAQWSVDQANQLIPGAAALRSVSDVAQRFLPVDEAVDAIERASQASSTSAEIYNSYDEHRTLLGELYNGLETDWATLFDGLEWVDDLAALVAAPISETAAMALMGPSFESTDLAPLVLEWIGARDDLIAAFEPQRARALQEEFDEDISEAAEAAAAMSQSAAADIEEWHGYQAARGWLETHGLTDLIRDRVSRRVSPDDVVDAVEHAVLQTWVDGVVKSDARLKTYRSGDRDALVRQFRLLDKDLIASAHVDVAAACDARLPDGLSDRGAAVIRREAQKKTRHKPIRQLLDEAGDLSLVLKPCFMMSPLSVSQYLPEFFEFDAVIFDEASQMLPADSINSVYRAKQLIVAGDQKQLPPTSFFTSTDDDESDDDEDDLDLFESLLDLAKAAGAMKSLPLLWHYRSQHESLITYSNYRFYSGDLHTFPGAVYEGPDLGIEHFVVPGIYRRGSSRDNMIEARAVVDRVLDHRRRHPDLSLGVVTFSGAQEDAVVKAIEERMDDEPLLADLLSEQDRLDGFFVKSLENVQGDERDIIVFTIGYGPDENGKLWNNFGPINRKGGWRRLNVAITRARRRVEVVSSFRASQMADSENMSVRHLRGYLDFAERGPAALALEVTTTQRDAESPFEEDVLDVIRGWGYEAVPQVGAAGYRIDIGVKHPERPGSYLLAVECDGAAYHSAKVARDRDRLREEVLRGLGWRVHRIWGISWYRERESQKHRLKLAIEAAVAGLPEPTAAEAAPALKSAAAKRANTFAPAKVPLDSTKHGLPMWAKPYREATHVPLELRHDPDVPEARPELQRYFQQVLAVEAPLHEAVAFARLARALGVDALDRQETSNARKALFGASVDGRRVSRDDSLFYRIGGDRYASVRVPEGDTGGRAVEHVCLDEIENAVSGVVQDALQISTADVRARVTELFGWASTAATNAVDNAIQTLINENFLSRNARGQLSIP